MATQSVDSAVKKVPKKHPYTFFHECEALADTRRILFSDPYYPMQQVCRESLCQVVELIFIDTVHDLIDSEKIPTLTRQISTAQSSWDGVMDFSKSALVAPVFGYYCLIQELQR